MRLNNFQAFSVLAMAVLSGTATLSAAATDSVPGFPRTILFYDNAMRPPITATLGDIQLQNFDLMSVEKSEVGFCDLRLRPKTNQAPTIQFSSLDGIVKGTLEAMMVRQPAYGEKGDCAHHWVEKPVLLYAIGFDCVTAGPRVQVEFGFFNDGICRTRNLGNGSSSANCAVKDWQ